jgi:hypothetical protein
MLRLGKQLPYRTSKFFVFFVDYRVLVVRIANNSRRVNGKTDSTADSDPVILENRRNRVRDRKHRFSLFSSVLELVTAGSDTLARTLN